MQWMTRLFQPQMLDRGIDMGRTHEQTHAIEFGELLFE